MAWIYNPRAVEVETGGPLGAHWPVNLTYLPTYIQTKKEHHPSKQRDQ